MSVELMRLCLFEVVSVELSNEYANVKAGC